jgi:hypothetical protein
MDITVDVGTDIASFYLYEPEALQHRAQSPWCWFFDASALGTAVSESTVPERRDGRLVEVRTTRPLYVEGRDAPLWMGSDGGYRFRCTTAGLTSAEARREYPETRELYRPQLIHVTHGRLLLDGGYVIPHTPTEGKLPSVEEAVACHGAAWLSLPNGSYQVTVHHLASTDDDDDEASIVLTFARVSL